MYSSLSGAVRSFRLHVGNRGVGIMGMFGMGNQVHVEVFRIGVWCRIRIVWGDYRSGWGSGGEPEGFMVFKVWIGVKISIGVKVSSLVSVCLFVHVQCQVMYSTYCDKITILVRRCHFWHEVTSSNQFPKGEFLGGIEASLNTIRSGSPILGKVGVTYSLWACQG